MAVMFKIGQKVFLKSCKAAGPYYVTKLFGEEGRKIAVSVYPNRETLNLEGVWLDSTIFTPFEKDQPKTLKDYESWLWENR